MSAKEIYGSKNIELSIEKIKTIIKKLSEGGVKYALLLGGEPLMRKNFHEIISEFEKNELKVEIVTNGLLLDGLNADILANSSSLIKLNVSMEGFDLDTFGKIKHK